MALVRTDEIWIINVDFVEKTLRPNGVRGFHRCHGFQHERIALAADRYETAVDMEVRRKLDRLTITDVDYFSGIHRRLLLLIQKGPKR